MWRLLKRRSAIKDGDFNPRHIDNSDEVSNKGSQISDKFHCSSATTDTKRSTHTGDMSHDAQEVLCYKLKNNSFCIKVDESTDFINTTYVVAFVRFVNDGEIQENFFRCKELHETSKGQD
jgi:hypothetical protein